MSYCRFTEGDVYAYACDGGVQFWVAGDAGNGFDRLCNTYNEAYQYAKKLRDEHGLDVPNYAIEALKEDAIDESERYFGPNGVVAELRTESAKLRELVRGLYIAYVGALNECEGMDAGLIWDHCEMVDNELAKSHARFEVDRHRFDVAMRELGVEVDE